MKKVVRCPRCALCAAELPIGFTSVERLYCTERCRYVDADDGCTLGSQGTPMTGTSAAPVILGGHEAVHG